MLFAPFKQAYFGKNLQFCTEVTTYPQRMNRRGVTGDSSRIGLKEKYSWSLTEMPKSSL